MIMAKVMKGEMMGVKVVCSQKCRKIEWEMRKEDRGGGGVREKKREKEVRR